MRRKKQKAASVNIDSCVKFWLEYFNTRWKKKIDMHGVQSVRYTIIVLAEMAKDRLKKLSPACHLCCPVQLSLCLTSPLIEGVSFRAFQVASCCRGRSILGALHLIKHWLLSQRWLQLARMSFCLVMYICLDLNDCSTETDLYLPNAPLIPQRHIRSSATVHSRTVCFN